jgi:hypothetical protein
MHTHEHTQTGKFCQPRGLKSRERIPERSVRGRESPECLCSLCVGVFVFIFVFGCDSDSDTDCDCDCDCESESVGVCVCERECECECECEHVSISVLVLVLVFVFACVCMCMVDCLLACHLIGWLLGRQLVVCTSPCHGQFQCHTFAHSLLIAMPGPTRCLSKTGIVYSITKLPSRT